MFSSTNSLFFLRHTPFISQFEEGCHKSVSNLFCTLLLLQLLAHICPVYWLFPNNLLSNTNVENVPGKWWCLIMAFNTKKSWKMFLCLKKSILCKYQFRKFAHYKRKKIITDMKKINLLHHAIKCKEKD